MAASGISIGCRPEIRKNCLWDVTVTFDEAILQRSIKQVYYGKPKIVHPDVYYLQVKVRSKLTNKQLSFQKVAVIESNIQEPLEVRNHVTVIKCKFNQRPRAIFHKHSDVMILMVSLKSTLDDSEIAYDEQELIFRGGTGSQHSADSRKKQILSASIQQNSTQKADASTLVSESQCTIMSASSTVSTDYNCDAVLAMPETEILTQELYARLRQTYDDCYELKEYKSEMEFSMLMNSDYNESNTLVVNGLMGSACIPMDDVYNAATGVEQDFLPLEGSAPFNFDSATDLVPSEATTVTKLDRKRKERDEIFDLGVDVPSSKRQRTMTENTTSTDNHFLQLFMRCFAFMTLPEARSICQESTTPFFIQNESATYLWANRAFCDFLLKNHTVPAGDISHSQESPYKLTKICTRLRDGNILLVGAITP